MTRLGSFCILTALALPLATGCWGGISTDSGVEPLAKESGWRDALDFDDVPYALVEIAYDRDVGEAAWNENVPDDLEETSPSPEPGVFGSLDEVDFETQALVVWSSGESGTCPEWLVGLELDAEDKVHAVTDYDGGGFNDGCTDDYGPYRMIYAVDRERLPPVDSLPTEEVAGIPDGLVRGYPHENGGE